MKSKKCSAPPRARASADDVFYRRAQRTPRAAGSKFLRCVGLCLAASSLIGCESCARGPGAPGVAPKEQGGPTEPPTPVASALPDACRGFALPEDQHYVAKGLCARLVAKNQGELRQITFAPNGDLFGVTVQGAIRRYRDVDQDGTFAPSEIVEWADVGGKNGNNCHIDGDFLYAGSPDGVKRWTYAPDRDQGGAGEDVMVGQPGGGNHPYPPVHVRDGWLYVDSGSADNSMKHDAAAHVPASQDQPLGVLEEREETPEMVGLAGRWPAQRLSGLETVCSRLRDPLIDGAS